MRVITIKIIRLRGKGSSIKMEHLLSYSKLKLINSGFEHLLQAQKWRIYRNRGTTTIPLVNFLFFQFY